MRRLLLMRHAKSDWSAEFDTDRDRPLNNRGTRSAELVGRALARSRQVPDLVIASAARRALDTARIAANAGAWSCPVVADEALYGTSPGGVMAAIRGIHDEIERPLLVGHEPTWSVTAAALIGGGSVRMRTAAVLAIDFHETSWQHIAPGRGEVAWMLTPRLFTDGNWDL